MSVQRIKITPEMVRQAGHQFQQASSQSEDMINRLNTQMQALHAEWEGMTQQQFYTQFEEWKTRMNQFKVMLSDISSQLVTIAARFEAADRGQAI